MLTSFWKGISDNLRKVVTLDADRPELIIDVELDVVQAHAQLSPCCPTKPTPQRHLDSFSLTLSQTLPPTSVCFRASLGPELLKEAGAWTSKSWTYGMSIGTSNIHLCLVSSRQIMLLLQLFPPPGSFSGRVGPRLMMSESRLCPQFSTKTRTWSHGRAHLAKHVYIRHSRPIQGAAYHGLFASSLPYSASLRRAEPVDKHGRPDRKRTAVLLSI